MQFIELFKNVFETILNKIQPLLNFFSTHPAAHLALIIATFFLLVVLLIINRQNKNITIYSPAHSAINKDIQAIAGEDVFATQLDLAKAYIEMNQKNLARKMLDNVLKQGNNSQKNAARQLTRSL